ncbi:phasin [Rhodobium orientis]|uniref:Phasin n=1 Tax=Rhodobium orientis TaxID=34017 RepID=A0A327JDT6_9HYPH|nr:phasin [Rhodobium orientis]MBB4304111.1 phasin [Rhodobium orientis]MBK5948620.1 phasin [Rhodobium orientis]RAI24292.1 phasin [Rhodobium orientis]
MATTEKTTKTAAKATEDTFAIGNMGTMEVPTAMREMAEKSVTQARDAYDKFKTATEDATGMMEDSYETSRQNAVEFNRKAIDLVKENTAATFDFFKDLLGAKSMAEAIELQTGFARKQFETAGSQVKDMQELMTKAATDASQPFKEVVEKSFKNIKVA